jgi:hypothetical protein
MNFIGHDALNKQGDDVIVGTLARVQDSEQEQAR